MSSRYQVIRHISGHVWPKSQILRLVANRRAFLLPSVYKVQFSDNFLGSVLENENLGAKLHPVVINIPLF